MTALEIFRFPATGQEIRMLIRDNEPLFCHTDVCTGLEHSNPSVALRLVDEEDRVLVDLSETDIPNLKRTPINPKIWFLTESGFYTLALASRAPGVKPFRRWVTHEVLPTIRRTGRYDALDTNQQSKMPQSFADALQLAADQQREIERQQAAITDLAPRAEQADFHRAADGLIAVGDFANKVKAWAKREHNAKILHQDVWDYLGDINLLIRGNTVRHNQPTAFATERDFVRVKEREYETNTHGTHVSASPRLTPAGEGYAWDRAVRRIAEHGSLAPLTAVAVPALPTERS